MNSLGDGGDDDGGKDDDDGDDGDDGDGDDGDDDGDDDESFVLMGGIHCFHCRRRKVKSWGGGSSRSKESG